MLIAIDISNNRIEFAAMEGLEAVFVARLSTDKSRSSDEYAVMLELICRQHGIDPAGAEGCIIGSVVPELTPVLRQSAKSLFGKRVLVVGPGVKTGLNIRIDDPSELASDFVTTAVAALAKYPLPCVTVNMDTALAIGVLDRNGCYIGGTIAAGVMASQVALSRGAAQLHSVTPEAPGHVIAKNTVDSMKGGLIYGSAAMLDGLLTGIDEELGETAAVVATGQWAEYVIPHCRRPGIVLDRDLSLRGLAMIYAKNR